jgi:hypothetical protein
MEPLTDEWVAALVEATASAADDEIGDRSGLVEVAIGKDQRVVMSLSDGRFVGQVEDRGAGGPEVDLTLPFSSADELRSYLSGRESLARAYVRGDFKPVGSTGVLLSVIELVDSGVLETLA